MGKMRRTFDFGWFGNPFWSLQGVYWAPFGKDSEKTWESTAPKRLTQLPESLPLPILNSPRHIESIIYQFWDAINEIELFATNCQVITTYQLLPLPTTDYSLRTSSEETRTDTK